MNLAKQAESDGWQDFNAETFGTDENYEEKGAHWETFEDGKYLPDYDLGWQNAQIEHELTLEKKQLEENNKMSITKEQLRSLIREQMSNVSEVADDDAPMMPAKPVDVPFSVLAAGGRVARDEATKAYEPGSKELELAMMVINMAEKQDQQKAKDEEPADNLDNAPGRNEKTWDFLARSMPDQYKKEENPFRVTKEHLQRIIKEELLFVLEGYKGYGRRRGKKDREALKRAVAKSPMRQGRVAARAGGPKKYPEGFTEEQKKSFDKGWDDEKSIMADEKTMKGESLEKTSINEQ